VSRDRIGTLLEKWGRRTELVERVHGYGTRFTCVDVERLMHLQSSIGEALESGRTPGS
jgi:hypothetical protein